LEKDMKKKLLFSSILLVFIFFSLAAPVHGQESEYAVHVRKNFGYAWGGKIRGTFTISLVGDETPVKSVTFLIDGETMTTDQEASFSYQFHTDDYGIGAHRLWAEVERQDGTMQTTPVVQYNFISSGEESEQIKIILVGSVGAIVVTLLIVGIVQALVIKRKNKPLRQPGEPRNYGLLGGTICPKCSRSFPRHIWGMNLLVGRLDRCENCGKWVMTTRATPAALQAAEAVEREELDADGEMSKIKTVEKDKLEDTRYIDDI